MSLHAFACVASRMCLQGAPAIFPLFVAASKGFTEVVEALVAAGAKPNMVNVVRVRVCRHAGVPLHPSRGSCPVTPTPLP